MNIKPSDVAIKLKSCVSSMNYAVRDINILFEDWEDRYGTVELNPDFQRGNVWTKEQQTKFMESSTKNHWRDKSKITDIESSIIEITDLIVKHNITSVSIPALGCGLGGLDWDIVKPIMEKYLINVDCYVNIHLPH